MGRVLNLNVFGIMLTLEMAVSRDVAPCQLDIDLHLKGAYCPHYSNDGEHFKIYAAIVRWQQHEYLMTLTGGSTMGNDKITEDQHIS